VIVVDASVWVSGAVPDETDYQLVRRWLRTQLRTGEPLGGPTIVLAEVAGAIARRSGSTGEADEAVREVLLVAGPNLLPVDETLAREAARLAADLGLRGADATYVATAARFACPLVTWDAEMIRKTHGTIAARHPSI